MTLMMFVCALVPPALLRDRVAVAITGALSWAVLLCGYRRPAGNVAYTMDVEYAFYVFFALALLCILSVSASERLRIIGHDRAVCSPSARHGWYLVAASATVVAGWLAATE